VATENSRFQALLEAKKIELESNLNWREGIAIEQTAETFDSMQALAARDLTVTILSQESELLRRVKAALSRIGEGTYGICADCERQIPGKRLHAVPWAARCVNCQSAADGDRSGGSGDGFNQGTGSFDGWLPT
jgi:DnaK suppressor protein